jgi:hypothetical protein
MAKSLVIVTALLLASRCVATEAPAPPLTATTLTGVWEGIAGHQLYRMQLVSSNEGYLAFITRPANRELAAIFRLTSAKVQSGHVTLEFHNLDKDSFASERVLLEGRGFAFDSIGGISAKLTVRGGSNYSFDIEFSKGAMTRELARMSIHAERLIGARAHNRK